jgi:2Fe-2S ferredoxin
MKVTFITFDGNSHVLDALEGQSAMQVASAAGVKGIVAECGGSAMCATCHVYVDDAWLDKVPAPLANELEMLECTASERKSGSRLSCQIKMTNDLDGLILNFPESQ